MRASPVQKALHPQTHLAGHGTSCCLPPERIASGIQSDTLSMMGFGGQTNQAVGFMAGKRRLRSDSAMALAAGDCLHRLHRKQLDSRYTL
jgi:hypothetical protein